MYLGRGYSGEGASLLSMGLDLCTCKSEVYPGATVVLELTGILLENLVRAADPAPHLCMGYGGILGSRYLFRDPRLSTVSVDGLMFWSCPSLLPCPLVCPCSQACVIILFLT